MKFINEIIRVGKNDYNEKKTLNDDLTMFRFTGSQYRGKDRQDTKIYDNYNFTLFAKSEAQISFYDNLIKEGTRVQLSGEVQQNKYVDQDGKNKSTIQFMVRDLKQVDFDNNSNPGGTVPVKNTKSEQDLMKDFESGFNLTDDVPF